MPKKLTPRRIGRGSLTLRESNILTVGSAEKMAVHYGSLRAAKERWQEVRHQIRTNEGTRSQAWWLFESGVPEHLREGPALQHSSMRADVVQALPEDGDHRAAIEAHRALDDERARYLHEHYGDDIDWLEEVRAKQRATSTPTTNPKEER